MDCRDFENLSEAVLEGEPRPEAHAHLASCRRCRLLVDELLAVAEAARALPEHEPGPELWARLEAAAQREGLWAEPTWRDWFGPARIFLPAEPAVAGLLAVLLAAAAGFITLSLPQPPAEAFSATSRVEEVAQGELVWDASYGARYQIHLQRVQAQLQEDPKATGPELRELASGPLDDLDRAIAQTQLRLNQNPEDTLAREELHRLYSQKGVVLQAMSSPTW